MGKWSTRLCTALCSISQTLTTPILAIADNLLSIVNCGASNNPLCFPPAIAKTASLAKSIGHFPILVYGSLVVNRLSQ